MKKRIGVCLSGCGVNDGSEIHESVITILSLDSHGVEIVYFAPNITQPNVNNHLNGSNTDEKRNVLIESARIARGDIQDISKISADALDAIIFPGGFGAALNLCDFGKKGSSAEIQDDVFNIIKDTMHAFIDITTLINKCPTINLERIAIRRTFNKHHQFTIRP